MPRRPVRVMVLLSLVIVAIAPALITVAQQVIDAPAQQPNRFEKDIRAFEEQDRHKLPPENAIVFTGSSSVRNWHKHLVQDFQGMTVLGRGFGGSTMSDLLHFTDRIVLSYKPKAVVVYEGDNDVNAGIPAKRLVQQYEEFYTKFHEALPKSRIYVIAIKPSPARWSKWSKFQEANQALESWAKTHEETVVFVDITKPMLNEEGVPLKSLFTQDNLHMNRHGYKVWLDVIKPILMKSE